MLTRPMVAEKPTIGLFYFTFAHRGNMDKFFITLSLIGLAISFIVPQLPLFAILILPLLGFFMLAGFVTALLVGHGMLSSIFRPRR